ADLGNPVTISSGAIFFNQSVPAVAHQMVLSASGTVGGSGDFGIPDGGSFTWTGGDIDGTVDSHTSIGAGASLLIDGPDRKGWLAWFANNGVSGGTFTVAAGTTLDFPGSNGGPTFTSTSSLSGPGDVRFNGDIHVNGTYAITGRTTIDGNASFNLDSADAHAT